MPAAHCAFITLKDTINLKHYDKKFQPRERILVAVHKFIPGVFTVHFFVGILSETL